MFRIDFTTLCRSGKTAESSQIEIKPPVGVVNLGMSCSATSDYLMLQPYYKKESVFHIRHEMIANLQEFNISKLKMWDSFKTELPEIKLSEIPETLKEINSIPMGNLIEELKGVREVKGFDSNHLIGTVITLGFVSIGIMLFVIWKRRKLINSKWIKFREVRQNDTAQLVVGPLEAESLVKPKSSESNNESLSIPMRTIVKPSAIVAAK